MINHKALFRPVPVALMLILGMTGAAVVAQIEGKSERGVVPADNQSSLEVGGILVDVYGKSADQARFAGWREAQRKGWRQLWQKTHGGNGPALGDAMLDSIVSGIIIEDEQIGPNRYVARLGVAFDRVRVSQILGIGGSYARSAPMLVVPVQWTGGAAQTFEIRTEWQKAWARFRAGQSPIDYVRPSGTGADPLLLNASQIGRRGRTWWRALLDQYGAADVLVPHARLERLFPGGPVIGWFSARYGPDNKILQTFQLRAESSAGIPAMMDEAVKRIDGIYGDALAAGKLAPDPSLIIEQPLTEEEREAAEKAAEEARLAAEKSAQAQREVNGTRAVVDRERTDAVRPTGSVMYIPYDSPDSASVSAAEIAARGVAGVRAVETTSMAIGGQSMMKVTYEGDPDAIRSAISGRLPRRPVVEVRKPEPVQISEEEQKRLEKERKKKEKDAKREEERRRKDQRKLEKELEKELERERKRAERELRE